MLVALDVPTAEEAVRLAKSLHSHVGGFKVGLELLMGPGPATLGAIAQLGKPVFADAKLHDIPATVEAAAYALGRAGARWVTVHATGGESQLAAAADGLERAAGGRRVGVLAVTVLTSLDDRDLAAVGIAGSAGKQTSRLAKLAARSGAEGVICSPRELGVIGTVSPGLLRVTPGIRLTPVADDQKRTATPGDAVRWGADWLVVGRPITRADDPAAAAQAVVDAATASISG